MLPSHTSHANVRVKQEEEEEGEETRVMPF